MLVFLSVLLLIGVSIFVVLAPVAFFYGLFFGKIREKQTAYLKKQSEQTL